MPPTTRDKSTHHSWAVGSVVHMLSDMQSLVTDIHLCINPVQPEGVLKCAHSSNFHAVCLTKWLNEVRRPGWTGGGVVGVSQHRHAEGWG